MLSLFLSHNSADKPFVRKLAADLSRLGVKVWIDEAEIRVGDSLIGRIANAVKDTAYVGAVISDNSVKSAWVQKELLWAMTKEIESRRVVVLPILIGECERPAFLIDKLYSDFRDEANYESEVIKLFRAIQRDETDYEYAVRIGDHTGVFASVFRWFRRLRRSASRLIVGSALFAAGGVFTLIWIVTHLLNPGSSGEFGEQLIDATSRHVLEPISLPMPDVQMEAVGKTAVTGGLPVIGGLADPRAIERAIATLDDPLALMLQNIALEISIRDQVNVVVTLNDQSFPIYSFDGEETICELGGKIVNGKMTLTANGKIFAQGDFDAGEKNGMWTYCNLDGDKEYDVGYLAGMKHGRWIAWYCASDGEKSCEGEFRRNKKHGKWRDWDYPEYSLQGLSSPTITDPFQRALRGLEPARGVGTRQVIREESWENGQLTKSSS